VLRELQETDGATLDKLAPVDLAELVKLKETDKISSTQQKKLFAAMWRDGTPLKKLLESEGEQVTDLAVLGPIIDEVIGKNPGEVEKYKKGNKNVLGFFVGQVMKATKGKAKPPLIKDLIERKLEQ
jgi:Asp-tRNA(Asn)/Glu-tRNA(Gln) amidotransferase B subunit